ncbi:MAG TPA: hypothetical protein VLB12_09335 [Gemmatimonadales bacterium]|nr:hypothetical protein [Gemmatimonadales bacterium]
MRSGRLVLLLLAAGLACGGRNEPEEASPKHEKPEPIHALATAPLAGQVVAVIPLTILVGDEEMMAQAPFNDHTKAVAWGDSIIQQRILSLAPEPKWVFPPELRRIAHRAVGVAPDPDHMGQGIMRAPDLEDVPDPLRSSLRNLLAVAGGRYAFIPAAISFTPDSVGLRVDAALALADVRLGKVIWRTVTYASGTTPERALTNAIDAVFPMELSQ